MRPVKILIRLRECAGWSESSRGAHVHRYNFWRFGSYLLLRFYFWYCALILQSFDYALCIQHEHCIDIAESQTMVIPFWTWTPSLAYLCRSDKSSEPGISISYKIACAPSEDSDQPAHPRSLIRVFTGHSVDSQGYRESVLRRIAKTLIRQRRCTSWYVSFWALMQYFRKRCALAHLLSKYIRKLNFKLFIWKQ